MLHRKDKGDDPFPITPEPNIAAGLRYADMRLTPDRQMLVAVQEKHDGNSEAVNSIVSMPTVGTTAPRDDRNWTRLLRLPTRQPGWTKDRLDSNGTIPTCRGTAPNSGSPTWQPTAAHRTRA